MRTHAPGKSGDNMAKFEAEVEILTPEEAGIEVTPAMAERARLARQDMREQIARDEAEQERQAG